MAEEDFSNAILVCPRCDTQKVIKVPKKILEESTHIVTLAIPPNYVCEHSFQAFLDRNCRVRGYQSVDYDLSELEIYETGSKLIDDVITHAVSQVIKKTIKALKKVLDKGSIIGGALFNKKGDVLYYSLPDEIFLNMIKQFELQKEQSDIYLKKMIFITENDQKVFTEYLNIETTTLIFVLVFPAKPTLNDANLYFDKFIEIVTEYEDPAELMKKEKLEMKKIEHAPKKKLIEPSNYWIYSKISSKKPLENVSQIYIDSLEFYINKDNILNFEEILEENKKGPFEGKIYFPEKYVSLMEGLALTMKDAATFLDRLNKK